MTDPPQKKRTTVTIPSLPPEILQLIVENVLPSNSRALLPPSHSATKTLLALTRVSSATYQMASRLLRQRCVYVESTRRTEMVLRCMNRLVPSIPAPTLSLRHVTSLYLEPFEAARDYLATARLVRELLGSVAETLRCLVVNMPFPQMHDTDDWVEIRRTLRAGFEQTVNVEEFVCLGGYPTLSTLDARTDVWRLWPDLRRLVLLDVPADSHWLWWDIATLLRLQHVVLARPLNLDAVDIKREYFTKLPAEDPALDRPLRVVLLGAAGEIDARALRGVSPTGTVDGSGSGSGSDWSSIDPRGRMTVEVYDVPMPYYGDETPEEMVTSWLKRGALDGTLWEWEGEKVGAVEKQQRQES